MAIDSHDVGSRNLGPSFFYHPCNPRQDKVQHAVEQEAQSEDKLAAVAFGEEGAHVLGQDVADGEAAQDQALFLGVPVKAAVAGVITMALKNMAQLLHC